MTFLDFYYECMENGERMKGDGLCISLPEHLTKEKCFKLIKPGCTDILKLIEDDLPRTFWGAGSWEYSERKFTPLRQTIVLLCAAMNNEL